VVFGEYECSGGGTNAGGRVPWLKPLKYEDARPYLDIGFIGGEQWLKL
jgi:pectinesterase